ncbi:MAG: right-handed parallel beta-helix repeat-containing protein [Anaerolineae bacterium]|nr:MAG: right-handed parallel beta-helix repeat-containing protein [Anaerolineae bacterium]
MDPLSLPRPAVRAFAAALILLISFVFVLTLIPSAYAATPIYVRTDGDDTLCNGTADAGAGSAPNCAVQTIQKGIDLVDPGGTVYVRTGVYVLSAVVNVNKTGITLDGDGAGATIVQVSGSGDRFDISASGVTMQDFEIEKTDTAGPQDIIRISNGNSVTIKNNTIHGQYVYPAGDVSRAMVINSGAFSGLNIEGNTLYNLRQPAYISGTHTGTVQNNHTYSTKGWVLEGGNLTFTGNTWGSGAGQRLRHCHPVGHARRLLHRHRGHEQRQQRGSDRGSTGRPGRALGGLRRRQRPGVQRLRRQTSAVSVYRPAVTRGCGRQDQGRGRNLRRNGQHRQGIDLAVRGRCSGRQPHGRIRR